MIEVNGKKIIWEEGLTVDKLMEKMGYTYPMIVVRINGKLIDKQLWASYLVPDGSVVQAHHMIAGG